MTVSIRTRLIALMLAAALPAVVIMVLTGHELEERVVAAAEQNALQQVQNMAAHHERIVENARLLLATLARTTEVRGLDRPACQELLQSIQLRNPVYVSLALVETSGLVLARAPDKSIAPQDGRLADDPCFKNALTSGGFATGDYVYLRDAHRVVLNFAEPVADGAGRTRGVLVAAFDLNHFGGLFREAGLFPGAALRSLDALHLAAAVRLGADAVVTYDARMATSARGLGLAVVAPG